MLLVSSVLFLYANVPVYAETTLTALQNQLSVLVEILTNSQTKKDFFLTSSGSTVTCTNLKNNLSLGLSDKKTNGEVSKLQKFLGIKVTGYFDAATEKKVKAWQKKNNIVSKGTPATTGYGIVGAKTRAKILNSCKNASTNSTPSIQIKADVTPITTPVVATATLPSKTNTDNLPPKKSCGAGWVMVRGNVDFGTKDFCVMQFEAQNPLGNIEGRATLNGGTTKTPYVIPDTYKSQTPVSNFSGETTSAYLYPWTYITQKEAIEACSRAGGSLMNMYHAQTINRDILMQPTNWQTNHIGQSCLFGGHLDLDPAYVVPAPRGNTSLADAYDFMDENTTGINNKTAQCPFNAISYSSPGVLTVKKNGYASRRTMNLSSGDTIWDWSGNASEWLSDTCNNNSNPTGSSAVFNLPNGNGYGWWDYRDTDHPASSETGREGIPKYTEWTKSYLFEFESLLLGPRIPTVPGTELLNSNHGTGMYFGCRVNGNAIYRGGAAYHGYEGGIFQMHADHETEYNHPFIGFRCTKPLN